ncbi:hypothetical protein VTL71DRAFT_13627 [Oculimacula yallundae]|uniref:Nuclear pore complex NUP2/50/61 domain-containing protein n=1 Tax=Oculimacula yallundae TaxID=86028 RepID=A0ABR4CKW7_9HELO
MALSIGKMSSPNDRAIGEADQNIDQDSTYHYSYGDFDHQTDPSFLSFDSNASGSILPSTQSNQAMAPPTFGGYTNSTNAGQRPSQSPLPNFITDRSSNFRPQQPNFLPARQNQNIYTPHTGFGQPTYGMGNNNYAGTPNMTMGHFPSPSSQGPLGGGPGYMNHMSNPRDMISPQWPAYMNQGQGQRLNQGQMIHRQSMSMAPSSYIQNAIGRKDLHPMHPEYISPNTARGPVHHMHQGYAYPHQQEDNDDEEDISEDGRDDESDDDGSPASDHSIQTISSSSTPAKYQAIITSENDFERLSTKRLQEAQKTVKGFKDTSPVNENQKLECIRDLFDAIMHTIDIVDKPAYDGRKAQAARRIDMGYYKPAVIETACWEIFKKCKVASSGHRLVAPYHKCKQEGKDYHEDFMERWTAIIAACKNSKAVCKQVLDPSYMDRLVDAPAAQFKMKLNNKKINAERDFQNKLGRQAINAGIQAGDLPNADEKNMVVTPSKNKGGKQGGSSAKRQKFRLIKRENPDEDEDVDEAPDYETPVKASRHTMSSRAIRTPSKRTPYNTTPSSKAKAVKQSPFPEPTGELKKQYSLEICKLLGLQSINADFFSLEELRLFARAYNGDRDNETWYHQSFTKGERCIGHATLFDGGHAHFCQIPPFSNLRQLACERGELAPNGAVVSGHEAVYYDVNDKLHLKQVLGLAPNAFGMVNYALQPDQED